MVENLKNYDYPAIGKRIKKLRRANKMSQAKLAELLEKSLRTVQNYESGEVEISLAIINKIAIIFESSPTYILGYSSNYQLINSMSDVVEFLFKLEQVAGLDFSVDVKKPPQDEEWSCSITFNGKLNSAENNADICLFMERWKEERNAFKTNHQSEASYNLWKEQMLARYSSLVI